MTVAAKAHTLRCVLVGLATAFVLVEALTACSTAAAISASWWQLSSNSAPTFLRPGDTQDVVFAAAGNLGDSVASGSKKPITISDKLPAGLTPRAVKLVASTEHREGVCAPLPALRCSFAQDVAPYVRLEMRISVEVGASLPAGQLQNTIEIEGGETSPMSAADPLKVADQSTPFGASAVELTPEDELGTRDSQAASHPFQLTTTLDFNQTLETEPDGETEPSAPALLKNLHFDLPAGLIGDPQATPQCSSLDFSTHYLQDTNLCPADTTVGVALVTVHEPANVHYVTAGVPVFNLAPAAGEPARMGFEAFNVPVVLDVSVRTGSDYSVQVNVSSATSAAQVLGSMITLWGEPGDPRHDSSRGWACIAAGAWLLEGESCEPPEPRSSTPFLRLPTSCEGPLTATLTASSWSGDALEGSASIPALSGCPELPFSPSVGVAPEVHRASTPTGLSVSLRMPQEALLAPGGLAQADLRDARIALPEGVQLSPSAANGLQACSERQVGFSALNPQTQIEEFTPGPASCPDASKLGIVHIKTPLLANELQGAVYLATPAPNGEEHNNPFDSLAAIYLVAEEPASRVLVKLAGQVTLNEGTLQATSTFTNAPQVPFEELKLDLFGGPRAALSTPPFCGAYKMSGTFTPWSGQPSLNASSSPAEFAIYTGPEETGCPGFAQPFGPRFQAQASNTQAAAFTPFTLSITRPDADQAVRSTTVQLPPGVAALLSTVTPCPEPQASDGTCPAASLIGQTTVAAGLGLEAVTPPPGEVFITGPYKGAPFGLSIVTPAEAGPFNLGDVIVRATVSINPNTAAVTINSDPLPTQLRGIPLQLKQILVSIDRPNFEFNPTNCGSMHIDGAITGDQGASAPVSSPFQVTNCADLPFKPKLTASTNGQASKANGANFDVRVESKGLGQANIAKVRLQLPKALPARLTTLQKACTEGAFDRNPASCPEGSVIGQATIHTPVLSSPLRGPAYLVSHGGAAFPDVEFVLQGEGITLVLDGKTQIKKQVTYSKFESAPDAPFTVFETVLPAGSHSALTANLPEKDKFNLCSSKLSMPTEIVGQSGALLKQTTKIAPKGCKKVRTSQPKKLTRAQLLKRALTACRNQHKHSKAERKTCEKQAHKRYAVNKTTA